MKKYFFLLGFLSFTFFMNAQNDCDLALENAKNLLEGESPFNDQTRLIPLLEPCASNGNEIAENYIGLAYLNGIGTELNYDLAYKYIYSSASKGYANAQYNLGILHKYGLGCNLSFEESLNWFRAAALKGNQRALYSIGYLYYKGFGVEQNYSEAVSWFEKSSYPMAKHFLAICHYFGYGVPSNETKAIELLKSNKIVNSKTLLNYVQKNQKQRIKESVDKFLKSDNLIAKDSSYIEPRLIKTLEDSSESYYEEPADLNGEWVGKLVEYDWSGKQIVRVLPININLVADNANKINLQAKISDQQIKGNSELIDGNLYFKDQVVFTLNKLYSGHPKILTIDYTILSLELKEKTFQGRKFLTGYLDTYIQSRREYGQPMRIVLKKKDLESSEDINDSLLSAFEDQENQFIKLYPIPFNENLTVQYELDSSSSVEIELLSLSSGQGKIILPRQQQAKGKHTHTLSIDTKLREGLYVVRLHTNDKIYTRMIIKDN